MHVIAAKAVAFGEALQPEFKFYGRAVVDNAPPSRQRWSTEGWTSCPVVPTAM